MGKYLKQALALVKKVWAKEPARVVSIGAAIVVFVAAKLGVIVPVESVANALAFAIPLLIGGEIVRSQVTPVAAATPAVVPDGGTKV